MSSAFLMLALFQLFVYRKKNCLISAIFLTAFSGLGALFLLSVLQPIVGISLPLTRGTAAICGVLGIPGLILLLFAQFFLHLL